MRLIDALIINAAYTGYRRSIDGVLEAGSVGATMTKSNSNEPPHSSNVDVDNHTLTSTATIITQNTSQDQSPPQKVLQPTSENFIRNEQQAQAPPQPAPRTRSLSSQNSVPMTNGNGEGAKADDAVQVRSGGLSSSFVLLLAFEGERDAY